MAREKGIKAGLFRPITLWPYPKKRLSELAGKAKKFLAVEMSLGQMVEDVRLSINGKAEVHLFAKPGGSPIFSEEIYKAIEDIVKKGAKEYATAK